MRRRSAPALLVLALAAIALAPALDCKGAASAGTTSSASTGAGGRDPCADHCGDGLLDCGEIGFDCGGECAACPAFDVATMCGPGAALTWASPRVVSVTLPDGSPYLSDVEEPEVRDFGGARWLLFNDEQPSGDKDLHYARWDDAKQSFVVLGLLPGPGAQTKAVDGNPSLDESGHFFFISTRAYPNPTETIYEATFSVSGSPATASIAGVHRLDGLSRPDVPWVTQGVQVTWDGSTLYFDQAKFGSGGPPTESDVIAAKSDGASFVRLSDADNAALLGNVNTPTFLEYAETLSHDGLEMYFTRTWFDPADLPGVVMCVMRSTRPDASSPFGPATNVAVTAPGPGVLMEAPSLSPDEKTLYYHRRNPGDSFTRLYAIDRP